MSPVPLNLMFELALNESPYPPLPSVAADLVHAVNDANRYPEFYPTRLLDLLARRHRVGADCVVAGAGSTGVALQFLQATVRRGEEVIYASPTFDGYPIMLEMTGARGRPVPLDHAGRHDLPAMLAAIGPHTSAVIICNPHNPTGSLLTPTALTEFLSQVPAGVNVVLDEAYIEFVADDERLDALALIGRFPGLLVLRTFSKAYGLAALRIGFGLGAPALIRRLTELQLPFGLNSLAEVAVRSSYAAEDELSGRIRQLRAERDRLRDQLSSAGCRVEPSYGNFLWLDRPDLVERGRQVLMAHSVNARYYPRSGIRVTVGQRAATDQVVAALAELVSTPGMLSLT